MKYKYITQLYHKIGASQSLQNLAMETIRKPQPPTPPSQESLLTKDFQQARITTHKSSLSLTLASHKFIRYILLFSSIPSITSTISVSKCHKTLLFFFLSKEMQGKILSFSLQIYDKPFFIYLLRVKPQPQSPLKIPPRPPIPVENMARV